MCCIALGFCLTAAICTSGEGLLMKRIAEGAMPAGGGSPPINTRMRIMEILRAPTIASATGRDGKINRNTADRMVDPRGYFARNKRRTKKTKSP
jgi:hypothetical protein